MNIYQQSFVAGIWLDVTSDRGIFCLLFCRLTRGNALQVKALETEKCLVLLVMNVEPISTGVHNYVLSILFIVVETLGSNGSQWCFRNLPFVVVWTVILQRSRSSPVLLSLGLVSKTPTINEGLTLSQNVFWKHIIPRIRNTPYCGAYLVCICSTIARTLS